MSNDTTDKELTAKSAKAPNAKTLIAEIERYEKSYDSWLKRAKAIVKRYRDDEATAPDEFTGQWSQAQFNVLWSNVQTLQPTLYARTPKPECERRFKENDPIGRLAGVIAERVGQCAVSGDDSEDSFDVVMRQVRDDYLLPGRGTAWVRYEPEFGTKVIGQDENGQPITEVINEDVCIDYIFYSDFGHNIARFWREVHTVWKKVFLTKEEAEQKIGKEAASRGTFTRSAADVDADDKENQPESMVVYEVWHKPSKKVFWIDKNYPDGFLKEQDDPLGLKNFFPCPRPLYASLATDSLKPIPDYAQYENLAQQLDTLVKRRDLMIRACQLKGARSANHAELDELVNNVGETGLVPVENWPQFVGDGGLKNLVEWLPLAEVVKAIDVLNTAIEKLKAELYEITGLADIIRGHSSPSETATAQQIKGQFATLRLEDRQREVQRFARDLINLLIEVSVEHYEPQKIAEIAGLQLMTPVEQQQFGQALQVLRNDQMRKYRVSIETDSTISVDENVEKEKRTEFLQAFGNMLGQVTELMQGTPELTPLVPKALMFGIQTFKTGREFESAAEQVLGQLQQRLSQPQPPQPDPAIVEAQAKQQLEQQKLEAEQQNAGMQMQLEREKFQAEQQLERERMAWEKEKMLMEIETERQRLAESLALEREKAEAEIAIQAKAEYHRQRQAETATAQKQQERAEKTNEQRKKADLQSN